MGGKVCVLRMQLAAKSFNKLPKLIPNVRY
jgi:hypothetical protein